MGVFGTTRDPGVLSKYRVRYLGGLPDYPKQRGNSIDLVVRDERFSLLWPDGGSAYSIPYEYVVSVELAPKQLGAARAVLGGLNSRQLNQLNNIHITYILKGRELVLRLEMWTAGITTLSATANRCRKLMDLLHTEGILEKFKGSGAAVQATLGPVVSGADEIRKLAELRDSGILTEGEFQTKKAELLARM